MRILYKGNITLLNEAVDLANRILDDARFSERILAHATFDNLRSGWTNEDVITALLGYNTVVRIETYKPAFRYSSVNARTGGGKKISMNARNINGSWPFGRTRSLAAITNTIIHEYVHAVDFGMRVAGGPLVMTHRDNHNDGDEDNTTPWAVGRIAQDIAGELISALRIR